MQSGWNGGPGEQGTGGASQGHDDFQLPQLGAYPPSTGSRPAARVTPGGAGARESAGVIPAPLTPALTPSYARLPGIQPAPARRASVPSTPSVPSGDLAGPRSRPLTLTAQLRSVQPPDVARQAMSELGVLARELATLPEHLEVSGLARTHQQSYIDATRAYLGLARQAWQSVAEERLEQSGAEPEYRQRAVAVARKVSQLQQECRTATDNDDFKLPRKRPLLWSRRAGLVRAGLRAWQDRLAPTPDPRDMGRGLFLLNGYLGLASAGRIELLLLDLLTGSTLTLVGALGVALVALCGAAISAGSALSASGLAFAALATVLVWVLSLLLAVKGPVPLGILLGAAVVAPRRSTRHGKPGSPLIAGGLRGWWWLVGFTGMLAILAGLLAGGGLVSLHPLSSHVTNVEQGVTFAGSLVALAVAPAAGVSLAALLLLGLPVLLITLGRFAAEFAGGASWVPAARRYALIPALTLLAPFTSAVLAGTWFAANALGWQQHTLLTLRIGALAGMLTLRGVALCVALVLPYLLIVDLPYRFGMFRWRRSWLSDLTTRRADVESHVRRLSVADPRSGAQDTSEENLRAMQYDLVLLQFYKDKIEEGQRAPRSPFALPGSLLALVVALAGAVLLDSASVSLAQALLVR